MYYNVSVYFSDEDVLHQNMSSYSVTQAVLETKSSNVGHKKVTARKTPIKTTKLKKTIKQSQKKQMETKISSSLPIIKENLSVQHNLNRSKILVNNVPADQPYQMSRYHQNPSTYILPQQISPFTSNSAHFFPPVNDSQQIYKQNSYTTPTTNQGYNVPMENSIRSTFASSEMNNRHFPTFSSSTIDNPQFAPAVIHRPYETSTHYPSSNSVISEKN